MISDTPGQGGRGVKKGQILADVLYGWPLSTFNQTKSTIVCLLAVGHLVGTVTCKFLFD